MFFHTAEDYHELNAGAHRNIPKKFRAPGLVWHLAFWIRQSAPDDHIEASRVKQRIDTLLLTLCRSLMKETPDVTNVEIIPCIMGSVVLFNRIVERKDIFDNIDAPREGEEQKHTQGQEQILKSTSRTVSITFRWHRVDCTIRCEAHTEYFTLTIFAEFDKEDPYGLSGFDPLDRKIKAALKYWADKKDVSRDAERDAIASDLNKYFFHTFWKEFADCVIGKFQKQEECAGILSDVFADCRGWVISDAALSLSASDLGSTAKEKLLPLIRRPNAMENPRTSYECTISYLLDGRAVYLSTLGPQAPSREDEERVPIEFILYAHQGDGRALRDKLKREVRSEAERDETSAELNQEQTLSTRKTRVNRWQLGRITNLMLLAETRRLAALKDIDHLHHASSELRKLDSLAQDVRTAMTIADPRRIMTSINNAHKHLNSLTSGFLNNTRTGLLYRIERSRYYVDQFRWTAKQLRIRRVEGDQPYDQFVERRIGAEFDFIDRLGKRYERATNTVTSMDQNALALRTNDLADRANRLQAEIGTIQKWGELALIGVLVPYYVMHLLDFVVQETWVPLTTIGVWTFFGAIAVLRMLREKGTCYAVALCVFGFIMGGIWWSYPTEPIGEPGFFRATGVSHRALELLKKQGESLAKLEKLLEKALPETKAAAPTGNAPTTSPQPH
jgi:hypothetical protein